MQKRIFLSAITAGLLFFSGCNVNVGDDTNTSSETNTTDINTTEQTSNTSGVVADGYIKGAKVCIDLNNNAQCDADEPSTATDESGKYTLSYDGNIDGKTIIAYGGFDINRSVEFNSTLESVIENGNGNITPITTFTYEYSKAKGMSFDEAKADVANILGISSDDISADPEMNANLAKLSLKLQLAVETAAKLEGKKPLDIYNLFANKASSNVNLSDIINSAFDNDNVKTAVLFMIDEVDKTDDIKSLQNIQNTIVDTVESAMDANITVSNDTIETALNTNQALNELNLTKDYFENKINSLQDEVQTDINVSKIATIDDAKKTIQVIRDTTYEFLDPNLDNQEQNTSTITGEVVSNYNNAINPAINNLNSDINSSLDLIDKATKQFDKDLNDEFNQSVTDLNDRLQAISDVLNEYNETTDFNATTDYNDTISYTYSKDENGYITETYKLNGKTLTAKFYENKTQNSYLATDPVSLSKDGEYNISLNSLSFNGNRFDFNISGTIYDSEDNSHKIEISNAIFSFDVNTTQFDNSIDKALTFSNINLNITGNVITNNGTFSGDIVLNDANKYLKGVLDYSNFNGVKIDGTLTINASTNDILKMANDDELKYDNTWVWDDDSHFILIDGSPAVEVNWSWNNNIEDVNLTALNGEVAHCQIIDTDNNGTIYHTANCDNNVTEYYIGNKVVRVNIDGTEVYLVKAYKWGEYDVNGIEIANISYDFKDAYGKYYEVEKDSNISISNIVVQNPTTVLDVPGDIKLSGNVQTPKVNLTLNLTAQSNADGKTYHVIAEDVNLTNGDNFAFVKNLDVGVEENKYKHLDWFSSYIIPYDRQYFDPDYKDDNTTSVLLQGLNAKLYDTNGNPISINDANVLADLNNNSGYLYGNIAYLDFNMTGFVGYEKDLNNLVTLYLNIERNGYEPFVLGANALFNDYESSIKGVIKKGDYLLYLNQNYTEVNDEGNLTVNGYDSNGVFINVTKQGNNDANVTITDKDGNSLATFDPKTNTITYNDGSSETLY